MLSIADPSENEAFVPLKEVSVDATVRSFAADVTITQVFRNDETKPIEAVYCFPIEEQAAIYSFTARIDDREIVAQLKEKKEAQKEYSDALQQGHGAYLLEQDEKSQDNFIINVGALPPSKECTIIISYVTELEFIQGSTIRFVVPTTIAPRYNPDKSGISGVAGTTSKYIQSTPYTIDFRCRVDKLGRSADEYITRVNSPSHPIQVDFSQEDAYTITFSQQNTHLDRDILLNIELASKRTNTIVAVEPGAVMASFTPTEEECRQGLSVEQTNEFIFVVDCSGSMDGENKIGLVRQAMLVFHQSLPVGCQFNIIRFGSHYERLFQQITDVYNEENARKAEELINGMRANLGGTELLQPLKWIEENAPKQGRARQIFLLTDGEISNVSEVLDLCRSMATSTRIFSFGLGASSSRSLVKGLARSTNGRFVFIPPNSSVDTYVAEQLKKALQPCLTNVQVKWNLGVSVEHAPKQTPPVYANDRLIIYALTNDRTTPFDHSSSVELVVEGGDDDRLLGVAKVNQIPSVAENQTISRLAAKALILELQHEKLPPTTKKPNVGSTQARFQHLSATTDAEKLEVDTHTNEQIRKQHIIDLSLKYNILSPHTAFVGIEKRINGSNADMDLREVPIQISVDDQHLLNRPQPMMFAASSAASFRGSRDDDSDRNAAFKRQQELDRIAHKMACRSLETAFAKYKEEKRREFEHAILKQQKRYAAELAKFKERERRETEHAKLKEQERRDMEMRISRSESSSNNEIKEQSTTMFSRIFSRINPWSSSDQQIVRDLINKVKFDGLWNADDSIVKSLTGKSLSTFQSTNANVNDEILTSVIIILVLESRFSDLKSLWHDVVQKARKRINDLLKKDSVDYDQLAENIRKQF